VVAIVGVLLWLAFVPSRLESFGALLVSVVPAAAVAGWASTRSGLVDDGQSYAARSADGSWFALIGLLVGAVVVGLALWADSLDRRVEDPALRRSWTRRLGAGIGVVAVAGVIAVSAESGGPSAWLREFRGGAEVAQSSGRLSTFSSNNRWAWWKEAWRVFESEPAGGKGAATFDIARLRYRDSSVITTEPHNVAVQALAETGVPGFLLGAVAGVAALGACFFAVRRLGGGGRAAAVALAIPLPVYLLHALADIDWEFVAVSAPVFFTTGLVIALGGRPSSVRVPSRPLLAVGLTLCLLGCVYSLAAPWVASNRVDDAYSALFADDARAAAGAARDARQLNPFSPQPLWALASAYASVPNRSAAIAEYARATRLQPENPATWYSLGVYELCYGDVFAAYRALNNAYTLDPYGPTGVKGGYLDQARAAVEKRGVPSCRRSVPASRS
jgi:hypothetical protein